MPSDEPRSGESEASQSASKQPGFAQEDELRDFLNEELKGYEILECLGQGGQAFVFEAYQRSTDRVVALKVLKEGPLSSEEKRLRFEREATIVSRMSHPNIIRVYDKGTVAGHQWISMEYIERGLPLDDYLALHRPSIREAVIIFERIVRVVSVAHQHGIIHRDLKPGNILMDADGNPHIADFGLAKDLLDSSTSLFRSETGQVVGTPPYLTPEQVAYAGKAVSTLSDVYSLGVTFYQMLTGVFPYPVGAGVTPEQARESILNREPMRMHAAREQSPQPHLLLEGHLSDDLEQVILKALRKDAIRRYGSAEAFADDLGRVIRGEAVEAKAERRLYVIWRFLMRHRRETLVAAAFVTLLASALAVTTALWLRAERVSNLSQFVWDTHALNQLGSVARDEKRYEDAVALYERSLEISEMTDIPDPTLLKHRYQSCHELAWLCYNRGDLEHGDRLAAAAVAIVERMRGDYPDDPVWERREAQARYLLGYGKYKRGRWTAAIPLLQEAENKFSALESRFIGESSLVNDRVGTLQVLARCYCKKGRFEEARQLYERVRVMALALMEREGETGDGNLDILSSDVGIARCYLNMQTAEDDAKAERVLNAAQKRLDSIRSEGRDDGLKRDVQTLQEDITAHLEVIPRRAARRRAQASTQPAESSSSSGEAGPPDAINLHGASQ